MCQKIEIKHVTCKAAISKVQITNLPSQFCDIRFLEKILASRLLLFKKVATVLKGESTKIKRSVCKMPVEIMDVSTLLSRQVNSNGLVIVKLNRKLEYQSHVYFEPVHPDIVLRLLQFLKCNNDLYKDITIVPSNIPTTLVDSLGNKNAELADVDSAKESLEPEENYLDRYTIVSSETSFNSIILEIPQEVDKEGIVSVASVEGKDYVCF